MAEIGRRRADIFLLVEEILSVSVVVVNLVGRLIRRNRGAHLRGINRRMNYSMLNKIPKQIEFLSSLISETDKACLDQLRMPRNTFARLCFLLRHVGGLKDSKYVTLNEKVASFLYILSHHFKNRVVLFDFKRSGHTISVHFHSVLAAVMKLYPILLMNPEPIGSDCTTAPWKFFQGCLGALDGTYIRATVPETDKARYRTRKGDICINMLGVCDQNMKFVYVLTGWEGSAADCRVLRDAVTRNQGFKVPQGHYYLCDNGYSNAEGFLTPYKGVRYHLNEWGEGSATPQNHKEYFNMCHSKARNVIERTFGLLKKRWAILRSPSFYPLKAQNRIIMACTLLHNFMRNEMPEDPLEDDLDDIEVLHEDDETRVFIETVEPSEAWSASRDNLAHRMFMEWRGSRNRR